MFVSTMRKIQTVADLLADRQPSGEIVQVLDDPWLQYFRWIIRRRITVDTEGWRDLFSAEFIPTAQNETERTRHIRNLHFITEAIKNPLTYPAASVMLPGIPDLEWLWENWIAFGLVSLLAATPGTGKSYLALDLAHRIITSSPLPDDTAMPDLEGRNKVLYVDAENTPRIFKKRTQTWNKIALDNLYLMLPDEKRESLVINLDQERDQERLWDMTWSIKPVLIVLDSYGAATLKGENNKEDVQILLAFLNRLARDFELAVLIVHHLRKKPGPQTSFLPMTLDSIRGSSHIPAMARTVLGLQWIPTASALDENGPRRLWVMKSNLSRYPEPLGVFFDSHPRYPDVALLHYGEAPQPYQEMSKSDYCAEWLEDLLRNADEPMQPARIFELGEENDFNKTMILRVRKRLPAIQNTEGKQHPNNKWKWNEIE